MRHKQKHVYKAGNLLHYVLVFLESGLGRVTPGAKGRQYKHGTLFKITKLKHALVSATLAAQRKTLDCIDRVAEEST